MIEKKVEDNKIVIEHICKAGICLKITGDCVEDKCKQAKELSQRIEKIVREDERERIVKELPEKFTAEDIKEVELKKLWVTAGQMQEKNRTIDEVIEIINRKDGDK